MATILQVKNTPTQASPTEYIVYAYKGFEKEKLGFNRWERLGTMKDSKVAIENAETLFTARQYDKIEIQKKVFDHKKGIYKSSILKTFEDKPDRRLLTFIAVLLLSALSASIFLINYL
jgi:hypothetical protein